MKIVHCKCKRRGSNGVQLWSTAKCKLLIDYGPKLQESRPPQTLNSFNINSKQNVKCRQHNWCSYRIFSMWSYWIDFFMQTIDHPDNGVNTSWIDVIYPYIRVHEFVSSKLTLLLFFLLPFWLASSRRCFCWGFEENHVHKITAVIVYRTIRPRYPQRSWDLHRKALLEANKLWNIKPLRWAERHGGEGGRFLSAL